ncbi:glycosyltransferase family 39 protein [Flavobacterium sp. AS60]|uniref:glycosyltransferase family 39 protein n=1 Tax=Flavobacterium anseongense TaxID=2910677 RepID=UPI001F3D1D49|nr:glycosyltransferase family 39 protein [Flavobacterium sp. AS60]MCF6130445.1 glycosyltransferase family 39 protein [Flavobacterium sp. AS60]
MKSFLLKYKYHFLIIFVGLCCLELLNFLLQLDKQTLIYPDCSNYLESAQKLYLKFTGHYYRPMLMAFITGIPYLFGSSDASIFEWIFVVNVFCWLGASIILFEILKNFVKEKVAFWFAIIPFLIFGNLILNYHLLTENIFVFFTVLAFYLLFQYYKTSQFWYLSLSLSLLLSSMLIKPSAKFFGIVMLLFFVKEILKNYKHKSMIFIYGSLLMITIQVVGMKVQYGDFTISYIDGVTYHNYICSKAECFKNGKEYNQINNPRAEYLFSLDFKDQKKAALEDLKHQIRTNFPNFIKAYFSDVIENSKTGNACIQDLKNYENKTDFPFWKKLIFNITKWQNRIFTVLAVLLSALFLFKGYKKEKATFFVAFFISYIIILSGISCGQGDRFHLVTFPFVIVLLVKYLSETKRFKPFFEPLQK